MFKNRSFYSRFIYPFMPIYMRIHEIIQHESLRLLSRCEDARKSLFRQAADKSRFSFEGMSSRERDKRESFIVRARLILRHRQSRESSGNRSPGGRRVRSHERIPGVESYVTVCTCSCRDNLPYKYDSRSRH